MEGVYFGDPENFLAELEEDFGADAVSEAKRGHVNPLRLHILYYPAVDDYRGGGALQATALAPTAGEADAWSTALFVLGPEAGRAAIAAWPAAAGLWVTAAADGGVRLVR